MMSENQRGIAGTVRTLLMLTGALPSVEPDTCSQSEMVAPTLAALNAHALALPVYG